MSNNMVGKLLIELQANSQQFLANMKKSRGALNRFKRDAGKLTKSLGGMKTAIAGAVGVGGLGVMINKSLKAADSLGKMSDRLNVSTESLAAMRHLMELNGESAESLEKSMQRMARGIGEAQRGFGTAVKSFDELGINIDDLAGKSADEQFFIIGEAIRGVADSSKQASFAADIFGRSGINLINTMQAGRSGFADARKEVDQFGLAINRVEAKRVEEANDAMDRLRKALSGLFMQATIELAPVIQYVSDKFREMITSGGGMAATVANAVKTMVNGFGTVTRVVDGLRVTFLTLKAGLLAISAAAANFADLFVNGIKRGAMLALEQFKMFSLQAEFLLFKIGHSFSGAVITPLKEGMNNLISFVSEKIKQLGGLLPDDFGGDFVNGLSDKLSNLSFDINDGSDATFKAFEQKVINAKAGFEQFKNAVSNGEFDFKLLSDSADRVNQELIDTSMKIKEIISNPFDPETVNAQIQAIIEQAETSVKESQERIKEIKSTLTQDPNNSDDSDNEEKDKLKQYDIFYDKEKSFQSKMAALKIGTSKKVSAVQKAIALKDTIVTGFQAIQKAWASAPFPANIPAVALTTASVAANVSAIRGQAHDGIDFVPNTGTWNLEKGERVIDKRTNADLKGFLSSGEQSQAQNISINLSVNSRRPGDIMDEIESVRKPLIRMMQTAMDQPI